jgi:hypothetical protein
MGGNCAVTLRTPDGTVYAMDRWTNTLPWGFTNLKFITKDPGHIADYLKQWLEMKEDWEKHKDTGKYELPMTSVYAPFPYGIRPSEYGIVVVDMVNNVILSHQNYSTIGLIHQISAVLHEDDRERLITLAHARKILGMIARKNTIQGRKRSAKFYIEDLNRRVVEHDMSGFGSYVIDMTPFVVEDYRDRGFRQMLERIKELEFMITPEEEKDWQERITEDEEEN